MIAPRLHRGLLHLFRRLPVQGRRFAVRVLNPTFSVGAVVLVERSDGRVLLVRHSYRRRWGTPGGLLNRRETPEVAAYREVREEVGIDVDLVAEPVVVVDPTPRRVDVIFRARPAAGVDPDSVSPRSPEIVEVGWFETGGLPELQHETAAALRALARAAVSPPAVPLIRSVERVADE
ncbi:MAG: NUDIX hydrolase [Acidimicrobiales bacterium]